jgi:hypothetical protein
VGFQRTVSLEPNNAVARYNLGTALLWRGDLANENLDFDLLGTKSSKKEAPKK